MAIEEMFTSLPQVSNSTMSDIICAVQGYVSSSNLGLSTQQTLGQVYQLFQSGLVQFYPGDPNGQVAGTQYSFCWDTVDNILWVCTTSGTAVTAVWTKAITLIAGPGIAIDQSGSTITISSASFAANFVPVLTTSQAMSIDTTYQAANVSLVTMTLPVTAAIGSILRVTGFGAGGWSIAQNAGQSIIVGGVTSSTGVIGSVSSTNQYDGIEIVCVVENTTWQTIVGPQGMLSII